MQITAGLGYPGRNNARNHRDRHVTGGFDTIKTGRALAFCRVLMALATLDHIGDSWPRRLWADGHSIDWSSVFRRNGNVPPEPLHGAGHGTVDTLTRNHQNELALHIGFAYDRRGHSDAATKA
jgi:hypothetical protein